MIKQSRMKYINFFVVAIVSFMFLLPIIWMVSSSLKDTNTIFKYPPKLLPDPVLWKNYLEAVTYIPFFKYMKNTAIISVLSAIGAMISTPPVAYAFAKLKWPGRNIAFIIVLSTLMLPFQVQVIPLYVLYKKIGWLGTYLPLILPNFFSGALYVFLMRQFMKGIPDEVCESAFLDGAGHFKVLARIIVPFCFPVMFAIGLFTFLGSWTDFFAPLIFLTNEKYYTISLGLQQYSSIHKTQWAYLMAACVMFTVPVLAVFFFTQKTFIMGITFKGVKG